MLAQARRWAWRRRFPSQGAGAGVRGRQALGPGVRIPGFSGTTPGPAITGPAVRQGKDTAAQAQAHERCLDTQAYPVPRKRAPPQIPREIRRLHSQVRFLFDSSQALPSIPKETVKLPGATTKPSLCSHDTTAEPPQHRHSNHRLNHLHRGYHSARLLRGSPSPRV